MKQQSNPFAFAKPITLDNLDDLFAHHRSLTGGWSMESGEGEDGGPGQDENEPPKFEAITSQEQFDRVLGSRLAREREKYADYDDLKTKAAEFDKATEAAKSEQEKAVDAARSEGEKTAIEKANARIISAEAKALAATSGARNASSVVRLLDLSDVKVGEDDAVDEAAIKAKLDKLKTDEPWHFGSEDGKKPPKSDPSQGGGSGDDKSSMSKGREAYRNSRRTKKDS